MCVFVAGHAGMVGSAVVRWMASEPFDLLTRPRRDLDLCNQIAVDDFFSAESPDAVVLRAGKVGGIQANRLFPGFRL